MSIKRWSSSSSFRFVSLYVLVYLISAFGFVILMFSILGTEIEDGIKRDIKQDYARITADIDEQSLPILQERVSEVIQKSNPLQSLYILEDETQQKIVSNYPYDVNLSAGWGHLDKAQERDDHIGFGDKNYIIWSQNIAGQTLHIGQSLERLDETKGIVTRIAIIIVPISLFLAFLGGLIFNRVITKRIEVINDHCRSIREQGDLALRVPNTKPGDEYGLLIANINAMLDAVDKGVKNIEAVSDDIAHDLRTPLSRMKYALESGLVNKNISQAELQDIVKTALGETDNLLETFSAILRISQLNSGRRKEKFKQVDMVDLVEIFVEAYTPSAEEKGHALILQSDSDDDPKHAGFIQGDKEMLGQLLSNLIENSLQHAVGPDHKNLTIKLTLKCDQEFVTLSVEDNGRGISHDDHEKVFDKFYRGDHSRTGTGNGLGLALVKAVADLHDAKIQLVALRTGVKFSLSFPRRLSTGL